MIEKITETYPIMFDKETMLFHAGAFFNAGEMAETDWKKNVLDNPNHDCMLSPAIVSFSFAAEIALKTIGVIENKNIKGHQLNTLFKHLSLENQTRLRETFKKVRPKSDFDEFLNNNSNVYTAWRYKYERGGNDSSYADIKVFAKVALDTSLKLITGGKGLI